MTNHKASGMKMVKFCAAVSNFILVNMKLDDDPKSSIVLHQLVKAFSDAQEYMLDDMRPQVRFVIRD